MSARQAILWMALGSFLLVGLIVGLAIFLDPICLVFLMVVSPLMLPIWGIFDYSVIEDEGWHAKARWDG